jgi:hypothetical protein
MSEPITKGLREYVDLIYDHGAISALDHGVLLDYADHIEEEYKNRLENSRREMRRAVIRYIRGVLNDYDHGIKRKRPQ